VLRLFGVAEGAAHRSVHSVEELKLLVHESQAEGVLEETQEAMLVRVFEFAERYVTETMIRYFIEKVHKRSWFINRPDIN